MHLDISLLRPVTPESIIIHSKYSFIRSSFRLTIESRYIQHANIIMDSFMNVGLRRDYKDVCSLSEIPVYVARWVVNEHGQRRGNPANSCLTERLVEVSHGFIASQHQINLRGEREATPE